MQASQSVRLRTSGSHEVSHLSADDAPSATAGRKANELDVGHAWCRCCHRLRLAITSAPRIGSEALLLRRLHGARQVGQVRSHHDFPPLRSSRSRARCPAPPLFGVQLVVSSDRQCCQRSLSVQDTRRRATPGPMPLHERVFLSMAPIRPFTPHSRKLRAVRRRFCTIRSRPAWAIATPADLWSARAEGTQPDLCTRLPRLGTQEHLVGIPMPTPLRRLLQRHSTACVFTRDLRTGTHAGPGDQR